MTDLQALNQKRLKWIEASHENDFDEGINRLLTELYPDNAHFIYELLQNAEDPKATEVSFNLTDSAVEFKHNGKRLFTLKDVESITSIGNSTKCDDETSIGQFGVGFKAVFAYTNSPEIHSGDFHFRIHDLVVPETKGVSKPAIDDKTTRFIFPFNNPKKSVNIAVTETETGLRNLGDNTLLFLSHIRKIDYTLPSGKTGSLQRIDHDNGRIEICSFHPGGTETVSNWLHFQKEVDVIDEDGKSKRCNIAIAYSLVEEANKKGEGSAWKIVPLECGQVSIYFPAEKETSNLRFHLHAPFASTVARDSVRDCSVNHQLRDHIAELIVESLISIRDQGLLTIGFLAVLPNLSDNLAGSSPFYEPIRISIIQAFKDENLMPTRSGAHASIDRLYCGPVRIAEVLNDDDLSFLIGSSPPLWAANPPPQSQREERFLDGLNINSWSWGELADLIYDLNEEEDEDDQERIEAWIRGKDDSWLLRFYALLDQASGEHLVDVTNLSIIRVVTENGDIHVKPANAFFPFEDNANITTGDILFVKQSVYQGGRSEPQKKLAKSFLEAAGVRSYDKKTLVQLRLEHYRVRSFLEKNQRSTIFKDMELFISYWKKNPSEIGMFRYSPILLSTSDIDSHQRWFWYWYIFLDEPYLETGLTELKSIHKQNSLWSGYKEKFSEKQLIDFINFVKALGVMIKLNIHQTILYNNPEYLYLRKDKYFVNTNQNVTRIRESVNEISEDYTLDEINKLLELKSVNCARLIWNAIIRSDPKVAKARYRPNSKYQIREADSQLVYHLKNSAWIPDKQGKLLFKPQNMTRDNLRDDFIFDNSNGLLTAICFGENAKRLTEEYQAKNNKAQELGFTSTDEAEKWAECGRLGLSPDELIQKYKTIEQPEESAPNPERRRKNALERSNNASSKESIIRERSIQLGITTIVADAKAYLREKYTNFNKELICQCCQKEMPFKFNDAYYFEAVQCIKELKKNLNENRLALCPICAAMYQYARETDDAELLRIIIENDAPSDSSSIEIPITLANKKYLLRFVGTHWLDLKTNLSPLND